MKKKKTSGVGRPRADASAKKIQMGTNVEIQTICFQMRTVPKKENT